MEKRQFRFKEEYFTINGIYNIPGLIICTGHGYDLKTYCCKNCGEIYVVDMEAFRFKNTCLNNICKGKTCEKCNNNLENCLLDYPENIFYKGSMLRNTNSIIQISCSETDNLTEVYFLS